MSVGLLAAVTVLCSAMGCIVGLMIVSLTNNKLEGMAMTKLAATLTLGILPPFFLKGGIIWLFSFLPSFWIAKAATEGSLLMALAGLCVSGVWTLLLARKFNRKV
jgi:fluoroquinolone transport system permease protein